MHHREVAPRPEAERWINSRYSYLRHIGDGGFGTVDLYESRSQPSNLCAVKVQRNHTKLDAAKEIRILQDVGRRSPRIAHLRAFHVQKYQTILVTDFYNAGDLWDMIKRYLKREVQIPKAFIWHTFLHLAEGLTHLHQNGVVHRDIKPENVWLSWASASSRQNSYPSVVIGDFGLASYSTTRRWDEFDGRGSRRWMAPETPYQGMPADVWALGACIHAMCHLMPDGPIREFPSRRYEDTSESRDWWDDQPEARVMYSVREQYGETLQGWLGRTMDFRPQHRILARRLLAGIEKVAKVYRAKNFVKLASWAAPRHGLR